MVGPQGVSIDHQNHCSLSFETINIQSKFPEFLADKERPRGETRQRFLYVLSARQPLVRECLIYCGWPQGVQHKFEIMKRECAAERRQIIMKESGADPRLSHHTAADAQHRKCTPTRFPLRSNTSAESTQSFMAANGNKRSRTIK